MKIHIKGFEIHSYYTEYSAFEKPMIKLLKFIRTNWITHANTRNHTYRQIKRKTWQFAVGAQLQLTNASWETMMHDDNFCVGDAMTLRRPWRFYDVAGDLVTTVKSQWCRRRPCDDREESMMSQTTLTNPRCRWRGPVTVAFQEGHGSDEAWSQSRNKTHQRWVFHAKIDNGVSLSITQLCLQQLVNDEHCWRINTG